jgi:hypothetical protein
MDYRWRGVVSFMPRLLHLGANSAMYYWTGSWVGPRASLDVVVKRRISCSCWESNPNILAAQATACHYNNQTIIAPDYYQYIPYNMFNVNTAGTNFLRWALHCTTQYTFKFSTILFNEMLIPFVYACFTDLLKRI